MPSRKEEDAGAARNLWACVALAFYALLFFFLSRHFNLYLADPDRFFHFSVFREMRLHHAWVLKSLPQASNLGWGDYFPDKEFLFHFLLEPFYFFGGENAVQVAVWVLAAATCFLIYLVAGAPAPSSLFLSASLLAFNSYWLNRMLFVRAYTFGVLGFVLLLAGLSRNRKWLSFAAAAFFVLSYHAFYLPAALCVVCWVLAREHRQASLFGLLGTGAGLLVNPYFPSNIAMALVHLRIALSTENGGGDILRPYLSAEFQPFGAWSEYLSLSPLFPLIALILGALCVHGKRRPARFTLLLFLVSSVFWLGAKLSPRLLEFSVPAIAFTTLYFVDKELRVSARTKLLFASVLVAAQVPFLFTTNMTVANPDALLDNTQRALAQVPAGQKVYNCSWGYGSYILFARPDLSFVDCLEPTFLKETSRELFGLRYLLNLGKIADPATAIKNTFGARYVLCEPSPLTNQMLSDLRFKKISAAPGLLLFEVR